MDTEKLVQEILKTVLAGGRIALDGYKSQQKVTEKADRSWVTAADLAVEKMAIERLKGQVKGAPFVGEESTEEWNPENVNRIFKAEYVWSIDPIDGTANYVNLFGQWAVSIGLLRRIGQGLVPWLGAVFFPLQDRILYSDGERAFEIRNALTDSPRKMELNPRIYTDKETVRLKSFPVNANKFNRWDTRALRNVRMIGSTVVHLGAVATGSAAGSLTRGHIWDIAGILAVCSPLGIHLHDPQTGQLLPALNREHFNFNAKKGFWNLHQDYLVAHGSAVQYLIDLLCKRGVTS